MNHPDPITPTHAAMILTRIRMFEPWREADRATATAWAEVLTAAHPPVRIDDLLDAVTTWYTTADGERRLMPAHLIGLARQAAKRRAGQARREALARLAEEDRRAITPRAGDAQLVAAMRSMTGTGDPGKLRRPEWARLARQSKAGPNRLFRSMPPPGGWPEPNDAGRDDRA